MVQNPSLRMYKLLVSLSVVFMVELMLLSVAQYENAAYAEWMDRRESLLLPPPEYIQRAEALETIRFPCVGSGCLNAEDILSLSWSLERYARMTGFQPSLLSGILMVENPWLDSTAVSSAGAFGLMQVMPLHFGEFPQCGNVETIDGNICYGAHILRMKVLHLYNGCLYLSCQNYDDRVVLRTEEF